MNQTKFKQDVYNDLKEAVDLISDAVKVTLGPRGKNVLIINNYGDAHLTKDGITVAKSVKSDNPVINGIINVVREASANTAKQAGDGPQPLYAKIMTPNGYTTMGAVQVGDIICGTDGTTQKVLGVFDKGVLEVYEVSTSDGRTVQCSENHLWVVVDCRGKEHILTTKELMKDYTQKKNGYNLFKYYIPNTFVEFNKQSFVINPYFLGVLLGDGCLRDNGSIEIQIGYSKKHILDKLNLPDWITTTIQDIPLRNSLRVKFKGVSPENKSLRDYLEDLGLRNTTSKDKFIPKKYLYSSKNQREELLRGLMDTDGYYTDRGLMSFSTVSEGLFNDVVALMRSLGKTTYVDIRHNTPEKGCYSYSTIYRICELKGYKYGLKITSIKRTGDFQPMRCIKVENNNHLYITNDFVSTHNTTSTLLLTQAIFNEGLKLIQEGCNPTLVKEGMQQALNDVVEYINNRSEDVYLEDEDKLKQIAYISANNDEVVGNIALEAVKDAKGTGICRIEDSNTNETTIKCNNGLTFEKGYISNHFLNSDKSVIEYEDPLVFVSSIELTNKTVIDLMKHAKDNDKPLIIIAPEFNESLLINMVRNYRAGAVQVCPIKSPGFGGSKNTWLDDITAYIEGEVYTNNNVSPIKFVGGVDKIIVGAEETTLVNSTPKLSCNSHICKLQARLADDISDTERDFITKRVAALQGRVVTIYVGATTELELKEKKDRIEDAVCALQTALQGGICEGGGITFLKASVDLYEESPNNSDVIAGYNIVINALMEPFHQLCVNSDKNYTELCEEWDETNGYNFKTLKWVNLKESGVIDPTIVLKQAITNAVGIASNLLTTNCISYYE